MCVDGGIAGRASQILAIAIGNMLTRLRVSKALGQAKVDHVHIVLLLANADQEVVWLDVSVQEVARVHKLYPLQLSHTKKR